MGGSSLDVLSLAPEHVTAFQPEVVGSQSLAPLSFDFPFLSVARSSPAQRAFDQALKLSSTDCIALADMNTFSNLSLSDRKIVVGIDFGTTYSGLAWAETRRPDHIHVVDSWPTSTTVPDGASSVKVPSELRYNKDGYEWGFQIPAVVERHHWFKLYVRKCWKKPSCSVDSFAVFKVLTCVALSGLEMKKSQSAPGGPNNVDRDAEQLLRDYLTALRKHLIYALQQKLGAAFRKVPLEFVLTVPAIWSEVAKEKTLKACQAAGFPADVPIALVSEPEAAAISALYSLDPHGLTVGDTFVLCDAGGGTVDLISYTITRLIPRLEIREAVAGSGALCGSTFLNRSFGELLVSKLSKEEGWDAETLAEAMERFDTIIKKQYSPSTYSESTYSIPVPGLSNNEKIGVKRGKFNMKPSDLQTIFDPIVGRIVDLVWGQIMATKVKVKAVLLVGGFGQSNHLKEQLRRAMIKKSKKIEVLQPPDAWTAVVRGAVMKGLANCDDKLARVHVGPRAARKHYAICYSTTYDRALHAKATRKWGKYHGEWRAPYLKWFLTKGDLVDQSTPSIFKISHYYAVSEGLPKSSRVTLYCDSTSETPPIQLNNNVVKLVRLEADMSGLADVLPKFKGKDGRMYYSAKMHIEANYGSASTEYVLICQGKRYQAVTAEYV